MDLIQLVQFFAEFFLPLGRVNHILPDHIGYIGTNVRPNQSKTGQLGFGNGQAGLQILDLFAFLNKQSQQFFLTELL